MHLLNIFLAIPQCEYISKHKGTQYPPVNLKNNVQQPGVVCHTYSPSTQGVEAEGFRIQDPSGVYNTLS